MGGTRRNVAVGVAAGSDGSEIATVAGAGAEVEAAAEAASFGLCSTFFYGFLLSSVHFRLFCFLWFNETGKLL